MMIRPKMSRVLKLRGPGIYLGVRGKELVLNISQNIDCGMIAQL